VGRGSIIPARFFTLICHHTNPFKQTKMNHLNAKIDDGGTRFKPIPYDDGGSRPTKRPNDDGGIIEFD